MKDWIEQREDAIERWADECIIGDQFLCPSCLQMCSLDDAVSISPDPWAIPVCRECGVIEHCS